MEQDDQGSEGSSWHNLNEDVLTESLIPQLQVTLSWVPFISHSP